MTKRVLGRTLRPQALYLIVVAGRSATSSGDVLPIRANREESKSQKVESQRGHGMGIPFP